MESIDLAGPCHHVMKYNTTSGAICALSEPLLPEFRALPGSGVGRTQAPCGLDPIPTSGDPTCNIGYPGQTGQMSCILRGERISARGPGGTGPRYLNCPRHLCTGCRANARPIYRIHRSLQLSFITFSRAIRPIIRPDSRPLSLSNR